METTEPGVPRDAACMAEIQAALDRYGCALDVGIEKQGRVLILSVEVVPLEKQP